MSDNHSQSDVPSLDEDLVAYLDGELEDPASRRLEERLANDESARERLRALATSWNLLDHLPRAALDEAFTRTTVELLVAEARQEIAAEQAALPLRKRRRWIAAAVAGLAAAMIGFIAVFVAWPNENENLLRDLPVVRNLERYEVLPRSDGIEFLRQLENEELFIAAAMADENSESLSTSAENAIATPEVLAARRAEVEALPPEKKNQLRKLYERFRDRPASEQQRLRELDAELRSDPDAPSLLAVLENYHNWLPNLNPLERAKLLDMVADDSIKEIRRLKREEVRGLMRSGKPGQGPLTLADVEKIEHWLQERASKQKDQILAKATDEQRTWFETKVPEHRKKHALVSLSVAVERGPPNPFKLDENEWKDLLNQLPVVKELFADPGKAIKGDLIKHLSKEVRTTIHAEVSNASSREAQQRLLSKWQWAGLRARDAVGGGVSPEELMRFFNEELSEEDRNRLVENNTAPDQFRRELQRKYFIQKELPPPREPWRRGKWDGGRGDGGFGRGNGHSPFNGERRRQGPPPDGEDRDDGDRRRPRDGDRDRSGD
jgi:hypothetical protein